MVQFSFFINYTGDEIFYSNRFYFLFDFLTGFLLPDDETSFAKKISSASSFFGEKKGKALPI